MLARDPGDAVALNNSALARMYACGLSDAIKACWALAVSLSSRIRVHMAACAVLSALPAGEAAFATMSQALTHFLDRACTVCISALTWCSTPTCMLKLACMTR